jgi:hypothetical protein
MGYRSSPAVNPGSRHVADACTLPAVVAMQVIHYGEALQVVGRYTRKEPSSLMGEGWVGVGPPNSSVILGWIMASVLAPTSLTGTGYRFSPAVNPGFLHTPCKRARCSPYRHARSRMAPGGRCTARLDDSTAEQRGLSSRWRLTPTPGTHSWIRGAQGSDALCSQPSRLTHLYLNGYTSIYSQQVIDPKCRTLTTFSSVRSPIRLGGLSSSDCVAKESRRLGH